MASKKNSLLSTARSGFLFCLAFITKLITQGFRVLLVIIRRRPSGTIDTPMPSVGVFSSPVNHNLPLHFEASREICKICYQVNAIGFNVPDDIWRAVVPPHLVNRIVCLNCFTRLADEKLIAWDEHIELFPVSMNSHIAELLDDVNNKTRSC